MDAIEKMKHSRHSKKKREDCKQENSCTKREKKEKSDSKIGEIYRLGPEVAPDSLNH